MLSQLADALKSVAVIVSFFVALALILVVGSHVIFPTPTIESFALPSSVQQWGYTPDAFIEKVSDGLNEIAKNANRDFDKTDAVRNIAFPQYWTDSKQIDTKIPGSDLTTRSAAQFISEILGRPSGLVTGVITKIDNAFEVSLRVIGGEHLVAKVTSINDTADAEAIAKAGSELVMQLTYPYILAASLYNDERTAGSDFVRTIGVLDYMINNGQELYYAHNLKCNVFGRLYKIDRAEKECEEAIKIDPANWVAHANLGYLYYSLAQKGFNPVTGGASADAEENCKKAVEQFVKAERSHHLNFLYDGWARCLDVLGRRDEASQLRLRQKNGS
jgi:tetratricopeptide (TPR) repeat protein